MSARETIKDVKASVRDSVRETAGVLLAGGLARRVGGGDKCLLTVGEKTLLEHCIARSQSQVNRLVINANGNGARFAEFALPVVMDTVPGYLGPLAGILAGMRWAQQNNLQRLVSMAADTPFFPTNLVERFYATVQDTQSDIVLASSKGRVHPVFGLWPVDLADALEEALVKKGVRKVLDWTADFDVAQVSFTETAKGDGDGTESFFNVNTPQDLVKANQLLKQ